MSQPAKDPWDEDDIDKPPVGIGGWLWLALLQLVSTPILLALSILGRLKAHPPAAAFHDMAGHPIFLVLTNVILLAMIAQILLGVFCVVQFLRKKKSVPRLMTVFYGLGIALTVLVPMQFALDQNLFAKVVDEAATSGQLGFRTSINLAILGIFLLYFGISKRVKNTFIR